MFEEKGREDERKQDGRHENYRTESGKGEIDKSARRVKLGERRNQGKEAKICKFTNIATYANVLLWETHDM